MNCLYFSTLAWGEAGGAHNPTQMARGLARRGHRVLFVEPQPSLPRDTEHLPIQVVALTELGMTPVELRRAWFGLPGEGVEDCARNLLARIPSGDSNVAIFSAPFEPFVRMMPLLRAQHFSSVYYAMDDFAAAPALGYTQFVAGAEEYLTRHAGVLAAVTPHIAASLGRFGRHAHVIPNGIDTAAAPGPNGLRAPEVRRGELTLGFWGTLMDAMFDADLVAHVAQAHPRWTIHLLGAVDPEPHRPPVRARLQSFPNVFFHGAVPHAELPRYAAAFDVCLAPFPNNAFTRGRDPIKVYEYLAAHVPVVASYARQLEHMPYVTVADSPEAFETAILNAAQTRVDVRKVNEFLAEQTWDARVEMLLDILRGTETPASESEDAKLLPSFAQPDANAVMRYARALEQELEQVQRWARELERIAQTHNGSSLERARRFLPSLKKRGGA